MNPDKIKIIIREIAEELCLIESYKNHTLMSGSAGIAIFLFHYARFTNDDKYALKGNDLLKHSLESISNGDNYPYYAGGITGTLWTLEYLTSENMIDFDLTEMYFESDKFLFDMMNNSMSDSNYDFLHGSIGIAHYFSYRKSDTSTFINSFVDILYEKLCFIDSYAFIESDIYSNKNIFKGTNLGLSHGMASIIMFLQNQLSNKYLDNLKIKKIIRSIINFYKNYQYDTRNNFYYFPNWITSLEKSTGSRLAWCYGDLGIGMSFLMASKAMCNSELEKYSIEILKNTLKVQGLTEAQITDPGFCHGAIGVACLYNTIYNITGIESFKISAENWVNEAISFKKIDGKFSGYKINENGDVYENYYGLLEGISGIGLGLMEFIYPECRTWKNVLMLKV